ncbi:hypothetical protein BDZ91DRAFT_798610 [Kalaharituber pfeilii]|nr:hypothetical protein BDZ91DRAFT_798610 [Kalaharituber pfeilii]
MRRQGDEATDDEATDDEATDDEATDDEATDDEATDDERTDEIAESRKSPLTSIFGTDFVIPRPFSANYNP